MFHRITEMYYETAVKLSDPWLVSTLDDMSERGSIEYGLETVTVTAGAHLWDKAHINHVHHKEDLAEDATVDFTDVFPPTGTTNPKEIL